MATKEPVGARNLDGYGAPMIPWERVVARLDEGISQGPGSGGPGRHTCWLATVRPDGRPHVVPLGALWLDGALYFTAGAGTRKAKDLARNQQCVITVATEPFDLIFEGRGVRVTDQATLERLANRYSAQGWPVAVRDGAFHGEFSAPSAGPPPWDLYEVTPETVFALGTAEPFGATRWRF